MTKYTAGQIVRLTAQSFFWRHDGPSTLVAKGTICKILRVNSSDSYNVLLKAVGKELYHWLRDDRLITLISALELLAQTAE